MHRAFVRAALPAALVLWLLAPGTASAFPLDNCSLTLTSVDKSGAPLGTATSGGDDSTTSNPFIVDWDGTVSYQGSTAPASIKNNSWEVDVFLVKTPLQGASDNGDGNQSGSGTVQVSANAPFRFTGLYYVSGSITGQGGSCSGSGWFKLAGDPVGTIPFFVGVALLVVGIVLAALAIGGSVVAGLLAGIVLGIAAAILLVIYSIVPLGAITPLIVLGVGLILSVVLMLVARARSKAKVAVA
ncbi:MAG: hypothetical protein ACHQ3P_05270 [Candidatus Limnocylindrales bacterium]